MIISRTQTGLNIRNLKADIEASSSSSKFNFIELYHVVTGVIQFDVSDSWGASNDSELDSLMLSNEDVTLSQYKHIKNEEINHITSEMIQGGYSFDGKTFSLSSNAQTNLIALFATKDHAALTYPIEFNTLDDLDNYYASSAATIEGMYLTALGTKKALLDSGSVLKDAVRAATTKAEVDLIIDPR